MKKEMVNEKLHVWYFQYKDFFFPCFIIFVSILLFIFVVIPQIQGFLFLENQLGVDRQKLQILQKNFQKITGLQDSEVNRYFALVTSVLPLEKDPIAILATISHTASITNLSLRDYNFEVGRLDAGERASSIKIELSLDGQTSHINKFIQQLSYSFPLSEITMVDVVGSSSARVHINFFTAPFPKISFDKHEVFSLLTPEDKNILSQLAAWQNDTK